MGFFSPLWLLLLAPWLAAALWILRRRPEPTPQPAVFLWPGSEVAPQDDRLRTPPLWTILGMLAALLLIVAASDPATGPASPAVIVVLDRGPRMSATSDAGSRIESLCQQLETLRPDLMENVRSVPAEPSSRNTDTLLQQTVQRLARESTAFVVLLSDAPIELPPGDRVIQIKPAQPLRNAGIVFARYAAGQVMVRVAANFQGQADLVVAGGKQSVRLSPGQLDVFARCDEQDAIEVKLDTNDDLPIDNNFLLLRAPAAVNVEGTSTLPPAVARVLEVQATAACDRSRRLRVVVNPDREPSEPALRIVESSMPIVFGVQATPHDVTRDVRWPDAFRVSRLVPGPGWRTIVRTGDRAMVAIRDATPRQVWIGFDSPGWESTADFVVFYSNVIDWLVAAEREDRSVSVDDVAQTFPVVPARVTRDDGSEIAVNRPYIDCDRSPGDVSESIGRLPPVRGVRLAVPLGVFGLGLLCLAAMLIPPR